VVFAERTCFLMEHLSHKDKQKEEVCLEKRRDQRQLLVVSQPIPWWKCFFPVFCMIFFLLSGENCTKKCYDPILAPCEPPRIVFHTPGDGARAW